MMFEYNLKMENQMTLKLITFFYLHVWVSTAPSFSLSTNDPFQLTQLSNITTLDNDLDNSFLVGLANTQARRYSQDFSSYTPLTISEAVDRFSSWGIQLNNIHLSNGTTWTMLSNMTITLSHGFTTIRAYRYPAFTQMDTVSFSEAILDYRGLPLTCGSNTIPFHIVVLSQTIKVAYKGMITTAFDVVSAYGVGLYITASAFKQWSLGFGGDYINITYNYFQSIKSSGGMSLIRIAVALSFRYNFASQSYDLTTGLSFVFIGSLAYTVTSMMMANGVLLMQEQGGGLMIQYGSAIGTPAYYDPSIGASPIFNFFINGGIYYILFSGGLVSVNLSLFNANILSSSLVSSLPTASYRLIFSSLLNVLYAPSTQVIYKSTCIGQFGYDVVGNCVSYNCMVAGCKECKLTANTCGLCDTGYTWGEDLKCSVGTTAIYPTILITPPTANSTTIPSNPTTTTGNTTTTPVNTTNNPAIPNITAGETSQFHQLFPIFQDYAFLEDLFWFLVNMTKKLISVPAARIIAPIFYYFGNFDDLYLYMYHDRLYGSTMKELFMHINVIETAKWQIVNMGFNDAGIGNASVSNQVDFEGEYLTFDYSFPGRVSEGSQGLLANCGNFLFFGVPLIFSLFMVLRLCFKALFLRRCSLLLRKFDFWGYFLVLVFEGNVQQFAFCLAAEWSHVATFALWQRGLKTAVFLFGFTMVMTAFGSAFILHAVYGRLNLYLTDNNRNNLRGSTVLILQSGIRNFILGVLHSILRPLPYPTMLSLLFCVQAIFAATFVVGVPLSAYRKLHCVWVFVWLTLARLLLIGTLFFDYGDVGNTLVEAVQCSLIFTILLIYIIATLIATATFFTEIFNLFIKIVKGGRRMDRPDQIQVNDTKVVTFNRLNVPTKKVVSFGRLKSNKSLYKKQRKFKTVLFIKKNCMKVIDLKEKGRKTNNIL